MNLSEMEEARKLRERERFETNFTIWILSLVTCLAVGILVHYYLVGQYIK